MTTRMRKIWLLAALLIAGLAALLIVAFAAGGQDDGSGIPTAGGSEEAAPADTDPAASADPEDAGLVYAQCVRESGYPEFPDPDADGGFSLGEAAHGEAEHDQYDPRLQAAMEACQDLRPEGLDHQDFDDPEFVEQMFEFAQCMRDNGLPDFPDPDADGRIVLGHGEGGYGDPKVNAAMQTCAEYMGGGH